jgi:predicted dehydrogenase
MIEGKVKVAFIGCGGIHWPHLNGFMEYGDKCQVVACCDNNEASAKASAEKCGGKVYTDWKKMLAAEGANIDAVDICLPHHLHKDSIIDAARAGKHVICEKPLCLNLKEADEIIAEVGKAGVTYMSAHNQVFDPIVENVKSLLAQGAIGDLYYVRTQDCFLAAGFAQSRANMNWRGDVAKQGGGELIDTGYHPSYLLLHIVGVPIEKVTAACSTFRLPMDAEDTALVTVKFQNGVIGQVMTSWAMPRLAGTHQIHCIGSTGQLYGSGNQLYLLPNGFQDPAHIQYQPVGNIQVEVKHSSTASRPARSRALGFSRGAMCWN